MAFVLGHAGTAAAQLPVIEKPLGIFSSSGATDSAVVNDPENMGVLVRVAWADLEPSAGTFNMAKIQDQLRLVKQVHTQWSLAVLGGPSAPAWLYASPYSVEPMYITFRGASVQVPKFWSNTLQDRLAILAAALAAEFGSDSSLKLVYLPQMSANGVEGHFNGTSNSTLLSQGFTEDLWVDAVLEAARTFASAFPTKPLAIELHYILGSASAGHRIMQAIEADTALLNQVGVAMWWLSGRTDYQSGLLQEFAGFSGDIYAQIIDQSSKTSSFLSNDYTTAFTQAQTLGIKYVEPWQVDIKSATWDSLFADFNDYAMAP